MKSCFAYLVNHTEQAVSDGQRSLALLKEHYLNRFPTPVVLFHEDDLSASDKERLASRADVTFVCVDFSGYPQVDGPGRLGYRHMCRFLANEVFHHPALAEFDYYCRLDTDSFIEGPVTYDLFDFAERACAYYGFLNNALVDDPTYTVGLRECVNRFLAGFDKVVSEGQDGRLFYTNFEVCYLPWFRRDPWQSFFRAIDVAGGIYAHRWGDHVIRYAGVKALMSPARVRWFGGIRYSHQGIGAQRAA